MLRQTLEQSRTRKYSSHKLKYIEVCYGGKLLIICKTCGYFLAPLRASTHYMSVDTGKVVMGAHFLLFNRYKFDSLLIDHENSIFSTEDPFLYMNIKLIQCSFCTQHLGYYFETANIKAEWLLKRYSLDMEKVELSHRGSNLMESTINQLYGALIKKQQQNHEQKKVIKAEVQTEMELQEKKASIKKEKELQEFILKWTNPIFRQNKRKGELAARLISKLGFFDRRTQRLQKVGKKFLHECESLKTEIVTRYEVDNKNKMQILRRKEVEKDESKQTNDMTRPFDV